MTVPRRFEVFARLNGTADVEFLTESQTPGPTRGVTSSVGGALTGPSSEVEYLVPTGKNLTVNNLYTACQDGTVDGTIEIYTRTSGGGDVLVTSAGCEPSVKVPVGLNVLGDGDVRVVLRRTQTPGPDPKLVLGFWTGVEDK